MSKEIMIQCFVSNKWELKNNRYEQVYLMVMTENSTNSPHMEHENSGQMKKLYYCKYVICMID